MPSITQVSTQQRRQARTMWGYLDTLYTVKEMRCGKGTGSRDSWGASLSTWSTGSSRQVSPLLTYPRKSKSRRRTLPYSPRVATLNPQNRNQMMTKGLRSSSFKTKKELRNLNVSLCCALSSQTAARSSMSCKSSMSSWNKTSRKNSRPRKR